MLTDQNAGLLILDLGCVLRTQPDCSKGWIFLLEPTPMPFTTCYAMLTDQKAGMLILDLRCVLIKQPDCIKGWIFLPEPTPMPFTTCYANRSSLTLDVFLEHNLIISQGEFPRWAHAQTHHCMLQQSFFCWHYQEAVLTDGANLKHSANITMTKNMLSLLEPKRM